MPHFTVHALPKPEPRHRVTRRGHTYADRGADPWKIAVRSAARKVQMRASPWYPAGEPVAAVIEVRLTRPKSHCRSDGSLRPSAPVWPVAHCRNDADNLAKAIMDALGEWRGMPAICWADDSQVVALEIVKIYATPAEPPGAAVSIVPIDAMAGCRPARWWLE